MGKKRGEDRDEGEAEERPDETEWTEFGEIVKKKFEESDAEQGDGGGDSGRLVESEVTGEEGITVMYPRARGISGEMRLWSDEY